MALRPLALAFALVVAPLSTRLWAQPKAGGAGSGSAADAGSAVEPIEEPPPNAQQMNGTEDNPDAPHSVYNQSSEPKPAAQPAPVKAVYPVEFSRRPITLTENLTEISITPHFQVSPFQFSDRIYARYGITNKLQVGVTYGYGGAWNSANEPNHNPSNAGGVGFHAGKAFGVDATYSIFPWLAAQLGLPFYVSPFAMALQISAPLKFHITDKFALGGLDDMIEIKLHNFVPSFYQEFDNVAASQFVQTNTPSSRGYFRLSIYGIYDFSTRLSFYGHLGLISQFGTGGTSVPGGNSATSNEQPYINAGVAWALRDYLDLGLQLGFDDMTHVGSFGLLGFIALRI